MTTTRFMTVGLAAFIGVGAMVGAGIFALLGPAGEVTAGGVGPVRDGRRDRGVVRAPRRPCGSSP